MTTVSLIQLPAAVPDQIGTAEQQILEAANSDLIVLPEVWYPGYFSFDGYETASNATPKLLEQLGALAAQTGSCLHAGSLIERDEGKLYNTSYLFGPDGAQLGRYRKMHLFGYGSKEQEYLTPGTEAVVVDTPLGCFGLAVCYDLRFPELFRRMTEKGAIGFLVASAWPYPRVEAWSTLLRARAIENQAFMIACNGAGQTGYQTALCGRSSIIDPWGTTVGSLDGEPGAVTAQIDLTSVQDARNKFPALSDRRILGEPDNDLVLRTDDGTPIRFTAKRLILAGYTARDSAAVAAYIAKLEEEGIAPPHEVPSYFVLGADRLTTETTIEVATASSCGEVEYALLIGDREVWVAVASDHTDRALEQVDMAASKQTCLKVLSAEVWRLSELEDHWDDLSFRATTPSDAKSPYQAGPVAALKPPSELLRLVEDRFGGPMAGTVILSGTIPARGEFEYHSSFMAELRDPVTARSLTASYSVINVLEDN